MKFVNRGIVLALVWMAVSLPLWAHSPDTPEQSLLNAVGFDQKLNTPLPLQLTFKNEQGQNTPLGQYFTNKPVVLVPVYYECPMLCTLTLNGLLHTLRALRLSAGKDFNVVIFSIDPREGPNLAKAKKDTYLKGYNRPNADQGWHFLTGTEPTIKSLTQAIGFRYVYDPKTGQFGHATGFLVATPQGRIARYFLGEEFSARDLRLSLVESSSGKIGNLADQVILYCFHYDPTKGRYSLAILNVVRILGALTVIALGLAILFMVRRERRAS